MNRLIFSAVLIALLVTSCSSMPLDVTATPTATHTATLMPSPTAIVRPSPTPTEVQSGKGECPELGHTTGKDWFDESWVNAYFGTMEGNHEPIGMIFLYSSPNVEGRFFYTNKYTDKSDEMKVRGCLEEGRDFTLHVYDGNSIVAVIRGQFPERDPKGNYSSNLEREVIIGTWEDKLTTENTSIYLRLEHAIVGTLEHQYERATSQDDDFIDKAAQELLRAVASDDREFVAQMIEYPIWATIDGERKEITDQSEFLMNYENIFTDEFKSLIVDARPHHMFVKWEGVMLGDGEIWFNANGKIAAINNGGG